MSKTQYVATVDNNQQDYWGGAFRMQVAKNPGVESCISAPAYLATRKIAPQKAQADQKWLAVIVQSERQASMQLTQDLLKKIMPLCHAAQWIDPLNDAMQKFDINTPSRMAAFLAQVAHESAETTRLTEGLSYSSAERLRAVWPSRFPTPCYAAPYVRNPEGLANFVYANRGGNGDAASGDGYRYRGRGLFKFAFRNNYREAGNDLHLPLEDDPDRVATPEIAALTAAHYWHHWELNALVGPSTDFEAITRRINGGHVGMDKRRRYWDQAKIVLGNG
jgi:putative chitinase